MTVHGSLKSGDLATLPSARRTPLLIGTCEIDPGATCTFDPGDLVTDVLGGGRLCEAVLLVLAATGRRVEARRSVPVYGSLPAVTHVGSGPAVTIALSSGSPGPLYPYNIKARVTVGGAGGVAQAAIAYDGVTEVETIVIPEEPPAVLRGVVDLAGGNGADLDGLTLVFTAPSATTLTFTAGTLAGAAAGLHAATATSIAVQTLLTVNLIAGGVAALLAHPRRISFTTASGGTVTDAPPNAVVTGTDPTGAAQTETITVAQTATISTGTKLFRTVTSIVYGAGDGTGATVAVGYDDAQADTAEVITAFNALAVAAPFAARARVYQASGGEEYIELYTTSGGAGVSLTIDAATSTADVELGFTSGAGNLTTTGSTAKSSLPFTGVDYVWPATSDYVVGDTYAATLPGPTTTVASVIAAATLAIADYKSHPFGRAFPVDPPASQTLARGLSDSLTTLFAATIADPDVPAYVDFACPTALHTASATATTNATNIGTNDAAMLASIAGQAKSYVRNRVHDDCYVVGSPDLRPGSFRQPAIFAAAVKHAGAGKIGANPGEGVIPGVSLLGPDLLTKARDEANALTHLGKPTASRGCWVLKSTSTDETKFDVCATDAGSTSRLRSPGTVSVGLEILRIVFEKVELWEGETPETNPASPKAISPDDAEHRANELHAALAEVLTPADPNVPSNVSGDFTVQVTGPLLLDDGVANVLVVFNPLAEISSVNVVATATGASLSNAA